MSKRKQTKTKLKENRCQGIGPDYVPFYLANEGGSCATAAMIPDPVEGRMVHCLSVGEQDLYYILRFNEAVLHIREQFLLDPDIVNDVRVKAGYRPVPRQAAYTTDFLVDFKDGHQEAYSVKFSKRDFDLNAKQYEGREKKYAQLIERQNTERLYWESLGVKFNIVVKEDLEPFRAQIHNIRFVMGYVNPAFVSNTEQKLLYLIANHYVNVDLSSGKLDPAGLVKSLNLDIDEAYRRALFLKGLAEYGS